MLGHHLTLHHNIIYIDLNTFAQLWFKHLSHYPLISRPCIFQTKGHHFVVVVSCGNNKLSFPNHLGLVAFGGILERRLRSSSKDGLQLHPPAGLS